MESFQVKDPLAGSGPESLERNEAYLIQQSLLPRDFLLTPTIEISYRARPFSDVGGDFLDYFYLADGALGLYLGDVVGKGLPAAMYGALAMGALRAIHKTGEQPSSVLRLFNKRLRVRPVPSRFCVTQYATFDPHTLELRFANAGLPLPIHISKTGCHPVGAGGLPSGMFDDADYEEYPLQLAPGDAVLFATDGLHEARDENGREFGSEQLGELCAEYECKSADQILDAVFKGIETSGEWKLHDDVTAVVLKVLHPSRLAALRIPAPRVPKNLSRG
jgi:phosphoserine phosphatase RsbU/P